MHIYTSSPAHSLINYPGRANERERQRETEITSPRTVIYSGIFLFPRKVCKRGPSPFRARAPFNCKYSHRSNAPELFVSHTTARISASRSKCLEFIARVSLSPTLGGKKRRKKTRKTARTQLANRA